MFKVYKFKDGSYLFATKENSIYGDLKRLITVMRGIGVSWNQIELGLCELERNGHDTAEYGVRKTFLFSKRNR